MNKGVDGNVIISSDITISLRYVLNSIQYDRIFILTDEVTRRLCLPLVSDTVDCANADIITIGATDTHKNLESLAYVWKELGDKGGTRHSLLVNIGGGMITDLGGFAASTFKRGIKYVNVPTTLLSMVDASVGGKTGINFNGLKNEIGVFNAPEKVVIDTVFLKTLDKENILSGYAEMLKHGLLSDTDRFNELLNFDLDNIDYVHLGKMINSSIEEKEGIVEEDPFEKNIRKALNLGHTVGHAFESWCLRRTPCLHGYAVAWGLMCELYLSWKKIGFPFDLFDKTVDFVVSHYGVPNICENDFEELYNYMTHDKKNTEGIINFTLLGGIGDIRINQCVEKEEIYEMLNETCIRKRV